MSFEAKTLKADQKALAFHRKKTFESLTNNWGFELHFLQLISLAM